MSGEQPDVAQMRASWRSTWPTVHALTGESYVRRVVALATHAHGNASARVALTEAELAMLRARGASVASRAAADALDWPRAVELLADALRHLATSQRALERIADELPLPADVRASLRRMLRRMAAVEAAPRATLPGMAESAREAVDVARETVSAYGPMLLVALAVGGYLLMRAQGGARARLAA